jgi:uncharacterized protein YndB with AHSA1/START domain
MSDLGQSYRVAAVKFERELPGTAERVWEHLSVPAKLIAWFGDDSTIEPREGGAVRLMGGHIRGVVTQWKPGKKLAYTWNVFAPGEEESQYPESYLTLELRAQATGVRLTLTHFPILEQFEKQNAMGWHTFLDIVGAILRGEAVEQRGVYVKRNAEKYGVDLNNLAR